MLLCICIRFFCNEKTVRNAAAPDRYRPLVRLYKEWMVAYNMIKRGGSCGAALNTAFDVRKGG